MPPGAICRAPANAANAFICALPYSLTRRSAARSDEILRDMAAPERMLRLLQGDVGAGKTVVALLSAAAAIESGTQAALMAPTEILARQHFATASSRFAQPPAYASAC